MDNLTVGRRHTNSRLPPEVNRILFVRNLPFKITAEELYDIFGKYGAIFQIRLGDRKDTRGTAYVVYEGIFRICSKLCCILGLELTPLFRKRYLRC